MDYEIHVRQNVTLLVARRALRALGAERSAAEALGLGHSDRDARLRIVRLSERGGVDVDVENGKLVGRDFAKMAHRGQGRGG